VCGECNGYDGNTMKYTFDPSSLRYSRRSLNTFTSQDSALSLNIG